MSIKYNPFVRNLDYGINEGDNLLFQQNVIRVKKNPGFGEFLTINDAINSISGNSSSNRYVIYVSPGVYVEPELDLSSKPYVSVVGESIQSVVIKPDTNSHHIFKLGQFNELSFV